MAQAIVQSLCRKLRSAITVGDEATGDLQEIMETLEAIHPLLEDAEMRCLCFKDDVPREGSKEIMDTTPEAIQPLLEDAPQQMEVGKKVRDWLRRVVKAAYDILDELQDTMKPAAPARKLTKMIPRGNAPEKKNIMAGKMEKIKEEVCKLRVDMDEFNLMSSDSHASIEPPVTDITEVEEPMIIGRDKHIQSIMERIFVKEGQYIMVDIDGQHGSGKTTLARMVFNHSRFKDYSRVWIQCSDDFRLQDMGKYIISQLSGEDINGGSNDDMEYVRKRLHQLLDTSIKVLVVLDGMFPLSWDDCEELDGMLSEGDNRSEVILLTTGGLPRCNVFEECNALSDDMCWTIIKQRSHFEGR
uniref:NB-ARC domain-containing protein n=2 Tax=Aegilops tauschii subsp. strangulata TaxID=200361 RepID=A0A453KXX2_AEGTS